MSADRETFYGEDKPVCYAASWAFIQFLRHGRKGGAQDQLPKLVEAVCEGEKSQEAIVALYGNLADLETGYRSYVRQLGR